MAVSLTQIIAKPFWEVHKTIKAELYSQIWLKGGRGSTKSSFVAIEIIQAIMQDPIANALVVRKVADTIRTSVQANLMWAIDILGVQDFFKITFAPAEITYLPTGQKIIMKGLDDSRKLKSIKLRQGYFKILWFEEADEFNGAEEMRNVQQSVLRGGQKFLEFITYNPPQDPNNWVNKESDELNDQRFTHHSTYLDVDPEWLGERFLKDAERLKQNNFEKYRHEYLGEAVGNVERLVFHGKWEVKEFNEPELNQIYNSRFFLGADWGFANDPTTLVRCFIQNDCLFIDYESGGVGVELDDIPQLFNAVPQSKRWEIKADCSRPETISHVSRKSFNIVGAPKWEGSVEDGITYLKSFKKIIIHPRCVNTIEEFKIYQYKVDKNTKQILPVLVDANNHYIDAIRYALADYITREVSIFDVL